MSRLLVLLLALVLLVPVLLAVVWLIGERGRLMLPTTREALGERLLKLPPPVRADGSPAPEPPASSSFSKLLTGLHGYVYGRWPERYIGLFLRVLPWTNRRQRIAWADRYHGKVLPLELAKGIITLDHDIPRTDLEQIIPYPTAREILLQASPKVIILDCPCRMTREDPCLPLGVCMLVGGSDFSLDHRPNHARRVTQAEALAILEAEHERGHVHTAYFKDAVRNRFYAICNCCSCCCGGMEAMMKHGVPMVASSGYVARSDPELCIGCEECVHACPFGAVAMEGDHAVVAWDDCMGCGVCESRCATGGMSLALDPGKGIPLDVREVGRSAAVP